MKIECKSCKGTDHKRSTNRLCPNSRWAKKKRIVEMKEKLERFEDSILRKKITKDDFAPSFCPNWLNAGSYHGNSHEWKLNYILKTFLFVLHFDIASDVYGTEFDDNVIIDNVSEETKIIFGIVGLCAGDWWCNHSYTQAHYGTKRLLKLWGFNCLT